MTRHSDRDLNAVRRGLVRLYARPHLRNLVMKVARRIDGGELRSTTIREIFRRYWEVDVGMYTHGAMFEPWVVDPLTTIGRYSSIAHGTRILTHNHPISHKGTSGLFFNPELGYTDRWLAHFQPLEIGSDVWIGANAVVLPEVSRIGHGAVIGAGAVGHRDVPDFAVVLGNPARVVKYRFSPETIAQLLRERWWDRDLDGLDPRDFQHDLA